MKKLSRTEAKKKIDFFFSNHDFKSKTEKQVKKIKKLAMSHNLPLRDYRKLFCKKCLMPYTGIEKVRIKNKSKNITCSHCGYISKWKIK